MYRSFIPVLMISLLSVGILTFCAPHPATAQPATACLLETA